jgi:NH3-dependent NAD+ synthetase
MSQQKPKSKQKQSVESIKKRLGVEHPKEFWRASLTPDLRKKLAAEDEFRLIAMTELHSLVLPLEVVEAIGLSGAIGSASELPSLQAKEVEHILNEAEVKRLLPVQFQIKPELIETMIAADTAKICAPRRVPR